MLHGLGFDPAAARTTPVAQLSGGERGRLGLVRQLVAPADVLLLDEPTNHLDLETTAWLESYLAVDDTTVLLISHDRAFLAAVADHVLHFEGDSATAYDGGYASFVEQRTLAAADAAATVRAATAEDRERSRTTSRATSRDRTADKRKDDASVWRERLA